MTPTEQRAYAHQLLAHRSIAADRDLLLWAIGASTAWNAVTITRSWAGRSIGAESWGADGNGVYIDGGQRRATLRHHPAGPVIAEVSLADAARLVARNRLPAALVDEAERATAAWYASPRFYSPRWTEVDYALGRSLGDIQAQHGRDCEAAAAAIWDHVRPGGQPVQLDLFAAA